MKTRGCVAGLVSAWVVFALSVAGASAQGPSLTRGPYLQSTTQNSVVVVWQTDIAGDSRVEYGELGFTQSASDPTSVTTHAVTLSGLTPSTTYQYRISTGGVVLHQAALSTASDASGFFNFVMIGDSGIGSVAQAGVAAQMLALDPDFMLHLGDVIYPSGQASGYNPYFFQPYRDLIDHTSVFPSLGNHDYITSKGQPYLDVFYLPSNNPAGTERYYSFDWGNAHFVALDSNRDYQPGSAMLQWLESDLAASAAKWKFVFFHHALHTSGPHRNDSTLPALRSALAPIFEQYDVDIVFNGHDHMYERSKPVNGVVYIVSGGGGAGLYAVGSVETTAYAASVYHTVQVQIAGCILSLRAFDVDGAAFDQIALAKDCPDKLYLPIILKQ